MNSNIKNDKLKYIENKISYWLILIALILVANLSLELIISWKPFGISGEGLLVAVNILIDIAMMLLLFLTAERQKKYFMSGAYLGIILAVVNVLRIFYNPLALYNKNNEDVTLLTNDKLVMVIIKIVIVSTLVITSSIITIRKCNKIKKLEQ